MKKILIFLFFVAICEGIGILGSFFTAISVSTWYMTLNKPFFTPPGWLFAPVWILLYFLIAWAAFLVEEQRRRSHLTIAALILFFIHLFFNFLWSYLFFGLQQIGWALADIILLDILIIILIVLFYKVDKRAAYLLIPYLAWVLFATGLNLALFILN